MSRSTHARLILSHIHHHVRVPPKRLLEALADPDPAVDRALREAVEEWSIDDDFHATVHHYPELSRHVPPRRWLRMMHLANLPPGHVGPVPRDLAQDFIDALFRFLPELHAGHKVAEWALRSDIFVQQPIAVHFALEGLALLDPGADEGRATIAVALLTLGATDEALEALDGLPRALIASALEGSNPGRLAHWLLGNAVRARVESDGLASPTSWR